MKKSKILISALSIASVGAVVAPMVTSCTKANGLTCKVITNKQAISEYKNVIEALPTGTKYKDDNAVTTAYANAVNSNGNIFADDALTQLVPLMKSRYSASKELTISVSNCGFSTVTFNKDVIAHASYDIVIDVELSNDNHEIMSYSIRNLPSYILFNGGVTPEYSPIVYDTTDPTTILPYMLADWSIALADKVTDKDGSILNDIKVNIKDIASLATILASDFAKYFEPIFATLPSNYLKNVVQGE